jgi:hypothetical protein
VEQDRQWALARAAMILRKKDASEPKPAGADEDAQIAEKEGDAEGQAASGEAGQEKAPEPAGQEKASEAGQEKAPEIGAKLENVGLKVFLAGEKSKRSGHSITRGAQGRRTGPAFNDAQRARMSDVYVQDDGRFVLRGPRGREHVFEANGELVTTIDRSNAAHQQKVQKGERRPAKDAQFSQFQRLFK